MSLFDLSGRVALITGSSRGIGKAIAMRMAEHGAKVVISSRKLDACERVAAEINAAHGAGRAIAVAASISSKPDLERLVATTHERFGQIDVLVCNAASNPYYGPQAGISDDQFRKVLDNNIVSNHWLCQLVAPQMMERRDGSIVIVSSIGGLRGSSIIGAYCISKAADMQLARNLAVEWGPDNIRVNTIAPGNMLTQMHRDELRYRADVEGLGQEEMESAVRRGIPLGRHGTGEDVAGAVAWLLSDDATYVTGQTISVNGGVLLT